MSQFRILDSRLTKILITSAFSLKTGNFPKFRIVLDHEIFILYFCFLMYFNRSPVIMSIRVKIPYDIKPPLSEVIIFIYQHKYTEVPGYAPDLIFWSNKSLIHRSCTYSFSSISKSANRSLWLKQFCHNHCAAHASYHIQQLICFWISQDILFIYRTRAIITRGLYTFYPLFKVPKRFFKGLFS